MSVEVWFYEKGNDAVDRSVVSTVVEFFGADEPVRYYDGARGYTGLRGMLSAASEHQPAAVVVASLASLGQSWEGRRSVFAELMGLGAAVAVCDCPHTVSNLEPVLNRAALGGLWDAAFGGGGRARAGQSEGR